MIKRRNMALQCLWFILSLTFYSIYWFYVTSKEMSEYLHRENDEVVLWTVLLLVPFVQFYPMYKQGELYETFTNKSIDRWVILLLWSFFPPAVWFIIQRKLNELSNAPAAVAGLG